MIVTTQARPEAGRTDGARRLSLRFVFHGSISRIERGDATPLAADGQGTTASLGVEIQIFMVRGEEEFDVAFAGMAKTRVSAVIVQGVSLANARCHRIAASRLRVRLEWVGIQ